MRESAPWMTHGLLLREQPREFPVHPSSERQGMEEQSPYPSCLTKIL